MGNITLAEYEMELAKLVEQARRLGVQADMLAAKAGDDMSEDVADMLGAALGDGMQDGLVHRLRNDSSEYEEFGRRVAAAFGGEKSWSSDMLDVIEVQAEMAGLADLASPGNAGGYRALGREFGFEYEEDN